jgi:hypothetical protein
MTAEELTEEIRRDTGWAAKLTEPLEIRGPCNLGFSKITHLSPLLTFWDNISLAHCYHLKVAEGTFKAWVYLRDSGIEETGDLKLMGPQNSCKLICDMSNTPLAEKNPMLAADMMTGTNDPKVWEEAKKRLLRGSEEIKAADEPMVKVLRRAIIQRNKEMMVALHKNNGLEI